MIELENVARTKSIRVVIRFLKCLRNSLKHWILKTKSDEYDYIQDALLAGDATYKIGLSTIGISQRGLFTNIPLAKYAVQQNILLKNALQQISLTAITSFSTLPYSKRYSVNRTDNSRITDGTE